MHAPIPYDVTDELVFASHDGRTDHVAWCARRTDSDNNATAAFIARACNAHYDLVESLEACAEFLKACESGGDILAGNALHKVLTTLAKAKP